MDFNQNDYNNIGIDGMNEENNEIDEENNEFNDNYNNYNEIGDLENNDNYHYNQDFNNDINDNDNDNDYFENDNNNFNINNNNDININNDFQNFDENDLYAVNMDNIRLKNKIQKMQQILFVKNKEINNLKLNFSSQMQLMNQKLIKYKSLANNYYFKEKNNNKNNNINNSNEISEILYTINQQIKSIQQDILEEPDSDIISQGDYNKLDKEQQIQFLLNDLNELFNKLTRYKNNNMKEIVKLRNIIETNESNNKNSNEKYYKDIINLIKKLIQNNINEIKLPEYSLNDNDEKKKNNIINTIKILLEYIINRKNINNKKDDELIKRLKEMSELLSKNSQNLILANNEINELKLKNNKLNEDYNFLLTKHEQDKKQLMNDLNKKNQQIKSLEHINTRLSNQLNDTKNNNNNNKNTVIKYGKINKAKNQEKNNDKINLNFLLFNKDEISEKNLEMFLNKFTDGEYGNFLKNKNSIDNENINIENLKDEIDKFNERINKDLDSEEKK